MDELVIDMGNADQRDEARYRRYTKACKIRAEIQRAVEAVGVALRVTNEDHHWCFVAPPIADNEAEPVRTIQWWPSKGRCVISHDYGSPVFVEPDRIVRVVVRFVEDRAKRASHLSGRTKR